ncbi:MAG: hypothetical protein K6E51_00975 [Treponema sp.]|nr:hypothetical protein [Treponema sp.]
MIDFYLKKNFCDCWDNMLSLLVGNVTLLIYILTTWFLINAFSSANMGLGLILATVATGGFMVLLFGYAHCAAIISDFGSPSIGLFFTSILKKAKEGFLFGLLLGILIIGCFFGIPMYFSMHSFIGTMLGLFLFWVEVITLLALQWFIPVMFLMNNSFKKTLKKCFILFFDNPGFTLFMALYTIVLLTASTVLVFLMPSFTGITLAQINALRLRLYKYDWIEQHPELTSRKDQKNIPWKALLQQDKETLGPRNIRSFIFPWKD